MKSPCFLILLLSMLISVPVFAQQTPQSLADAELPSLLAIYKDVHTHPELSGHEERTAAIVAKDLKAAGCEVTEPVGKYDKPSLTCFGVVGVMKNGEGPTTLVRTDMDALPVKEETGLPYASKVMTKNDSGQEVSVMHACGHDAHIAAFIGTARALQKLKDQWAGTIIFVGQPAEEAIGGARALLKGGLYDRFGKPNFALGFHDKRANADWPYRRNRRLHLCERRRSRRDGFRSWWPRGLSTQDEGPGRARRGNDQHVANDCQPGKQSD